MRIGSLSVRNAVTVVEGWCREEQHQKLRLIKRYRSDCDDSKQKKGRNFVPTFFNSYYQLPTTNYQRRSRYSRPVSKQVPLSIVADGL